MQKAQEYLNDIQFDSLKLELSALDLHYLDANVEAVKLLDEIRVISRPHGLDRLFPVTKLEIPLDSPEQTTFTLGDSVEVSLTSVNNQTNSEILDKIEKLPKAHSILKEAKQNATDIMHMATTGYITITQDEYGSETLYITNTRDYLTADKMWKWNMNGLGYSKDGGKTFGLAITMDGAIVADYITAGVLNGDVIRTGVIRDNNSNVVIDLTNGTLTMKKGSIDIGDGNFTVDNEGNLYAKRGTFAGTLSSAKGTFGGKVQAEDYLDKNGNSMMDSLGRFKSSYLNVRGLNVNNKFIIGEDGNVTINGGSISWSAVVGSQNIDDKLDNVTDVINDWAGNYDIYTRKTKINGKMLETGTVTATKLQGETVALIDEYSNSVGTVTIGDTQTGDGWELTTNQGGIRFTSGGNVFFGTPNVRNDYGSRVEGANFMLSNATGHYSDTYAAIHAYRVSIGEYIALDFKAVSTSINLGTAPHPWGTVYAATGTIQTSDAMKKHDIEDLPDKYVKMVSLITPKRFKMNDGTSGRYHVGFIAQDVELAMAEAGIDSMEFGGFVADVDETGLPVYMLRYNEFQPIILVYLKELDSRMKVLENKCFLGGIN